MPSVPMVKWLLGNIAGYQHQQNFAGSVQTHSNNLEGTRKPLVMS